MLKEFYILIFKNFSVCGHGVTLLCYLPEDFIVLSVCECG